MNIPFSNLQSQWRDIEHEVMPRISSILSNANYILGEDVSKFESQFANYCNVNHSVGCASGLDALRLGLRALNIGHGDEVILPANTFIATALAVTQVGALPVLVDCEESTFCIDPSKILEKVSSKTKAIIPVHLYGHPADMNPINKIARECQLKVIEDASQAHGAKYQGNKVGGLADIAAFSLYPGKNLGAAGDAGVITTGNESIYAKLKSLRNYGSTIKYIHDSLGENSRLDTLQAAVVSAKLGHLESWNNVRRLAASKYSLLLEGVGDIVVPTIADGSEHVFHLYVIRTNFRNELMAYLTERGIGCLIHYPTPVHRQVAYKNIFSEKIHFPVAEAVSEQILSLPMHGHIKEEEVEYVCQAIRSFFEKR